MGGVKLKRSHYPILESTMLTARQLAERLAARFLSRGSYSFAPTKRIPSHGGVAPASGDAAAMESLFVEEGFAGLAVQSVGYEEGASDPKVHVYVTKGTRRAERSLVEDDHDIPIVINRMGKLVVRPEQASGATNQGNVYTYKRRVACGSSCAPTQESYSGTLGALAGKKGSKDLYILSNNHVLAACNHVPVGMPILSPSNMDGRPGVRAPGEVARHAEIVALASGEPSLVPPCREDVAIARVVDSAIVASWQGDSSAGYDTPAKVVAPASGMRVKKYGRTTGLTVGAVESLIPTPTAIPYKATHFTATVWMRDVWTVAADPGTAFALPGDSGSLVVTEAGDSAVGLVFAASPQGDYGWIVPMTHITSLFGGLRLVSGHGI